MATILRRNHGAAAPCNTVGGPIAEVGGVEEEFLFGGTASMFELEHGGADYAPDGRWSAAAKEQAPFRSRMLVARPAPPARCNGSVIVTWNNVSRGQDSFLDPVRAAQLVADGFALVAVSAQFVGVMGRHDGALPDHDDGAVDPERLPGLRGEDPERYGTLTHPGDGYSYDIFSQAGALLGPDRPRDLDPLGGLDVRHVVATGGSQSANRLGAYFNGVQPLADVYDAFLLVIYAGCPCALDPATAPASLPQVPSNIVELLAWRTFVLRDDLDVPVIIVNSEFESEQCFPNVQHDSDTFRTWEIAGTAHLGASAAPEVFALMPTINQVSFAPAHRAAIHALRAWLDGEGAPPPQPRLAKQGDPPALPRDEHGNAIGGIRWPDVVAPLGTHVGECAPEGHANLMGSTAWFSPEKVRALYPDHAAWLAQYTAAVECLVEDQVVLPDDAAQMIAAAAAHQLPV